MLGLLRDEVRLGAKAERRIDRLYFGLNTWLLALVLIAILFGATLLGWLAGRSWVGIAKPFASRLASSRRRY